MRRLAIIAFLLATAFSAAPLQAQVVGDCAPGSAEADLSVNEVFARVRNDGNLFGDSDNLNLGLYQVPKNLEPVACSDEWWCHPALFDWGNLMVGGKADGALRFAGGPFAREFWPGPLRLEGTPPQYCAGYDRIFSVDRGDVARFHETGIATDDLRDWPVELGAPVLDGDGVAGNYDLDGGDEPAISGDRTLWWVMNDAGNAHTTTETPPLPVEVRVTAFGAGTRTEAIHRATLYRYAVTYKDEATLDSVFVGLFMSPRIGAGGVRVGSDTTLDLTYAYGGVNISSPVLNEVYGPPPAGGVLFLETPVGLPNGRDDDVDGTVDEPGERLGLTAFTHTYDDWDPTCCITPRGRGFYNYLQGRFSSGRVLREGGFGWNEEGRPTSFAFPGDPVAGTFWSEANLDGMGTASEHGQRWMISSTGPFVLEAGDTAEVVFAVLFAQGTDELDSVAELRDVARTVQSAYASGFFEPQRVGTPVEPEPPTAFALSRPFPNPFRDSAAFTLTVPEGAGAVRLAVYDVLGREVAVLADGVLAPGEHPFTLDGARLPAGAYFVRLATGRQAETLTVVHVE